MKPIEIVISALTILTAVIHLYAGFSYSQTILVLNGLGYIGLLAALLLPIPILSRLKKITVVVLILYTLLTIVMYFKDHKLYYKVKAHGADEEELIPEATVEPTQTGTIEAPSNKTTQLEESEPETQGAVDVPSTANSVVKYKYAFDELGLSSKLIEGLLVLSLIAYLRTLMSVKKDA